MQRRAVLLALSACAVQRRAWATLDDAYTRRCLEDQSGRETSLKQEAGNRSLVVVVMKGYWCQVCVAQLQRFEQLTSRLDTLNARFVGLNADAPADNQAMRKKEGLSCPVLSDRRHEVIEQLGLWLPRAEHPLPALVVFDRCGDEAARWVGRRAGDRPEGGVLRVLQKLSESKAVCPAPNA